jgi:hypothetical protein
VLALFWFLNPFWYFGLSRWLVARWRPRREIVPEPRFYGRFRSDKAATLNYLRWVWWCTPAGHRRLATILGTVTVRIDPDVITLETCDPPETRPYKVFARGENSVTIECVTDRVLGEAPRPWRWTIDFVEDGYWTCTQFWWLWWYREKFTRITDESSPGKFTPAPA